jgi:hypothetical protein
MEDIGGGTFAFYLMEVLLDTGKVLEVVEKKLTDDFSDEEGGVKVVVLLDGFCHVPRARHTLQPKVKTKLK